PITSEQLSFRLDAASASLNEVVVTGYTTQRKADATGSVSTISMDNQLQGKAAGISVRGRSSTTDYSVSAPTTVPIEVNQIENQTNVEFDIADPYTITNDGKQCTVDINQFDLKAIYQYAV